MTTAPLPNHHQRAAAVREGLVAARRRKYEEMRLIDGALSQLAASLREAKGMEAKHQAIGIVEAILADVQ